MAVTAIGGAIGVAAGAKVVEKLCDEVYSSGIHLFKQKKIRKINKNTFKTIYKKLQSVENVKTIWKVDDEVNLRDFYYPSKLRLRNQRSLLEVEKVSDISERNNIVIEGTAGQGKSILLRYLTSNEIRKGDRVPIFIELRRVKEDQTIESAIIKKLDALGFHVNKEIVDEFLKSGKFVLMLDGFDEIHSHATVTITNDIEALSEKYQDTQIVITSRPGSGI